MTTMTRFYNTIAAATEGLYKERGSKFIAYAFPISHEDEAISKLKQVRSNHPKARHYCYAYRLTPDGSVYRQNDDGEPSSTAGRPILGQIDSYELTNVLVVVVRYFGGKLLGASGLITAYKESTNDALKQAIIRKCEVRAHFELRFQYAIMGALMESLNRYGATILHQDFDEKGPTIRVSLPLTNPEQQMDQIIAATLHRYVGEIEGERTFEQMSVTRFEDH